MLPGAEDLEALKWIGNRIEGNWREVKGKVKQKWGQLTDDDLSKINRRRDQLEGKIQQRYGGQGSSAKRRRRLAECSAIAPNG